MRSSANNSAKWEANGGQPVATLLGQTGYSSSEDDEMTRLKPGGGTSTGSSSGHGCPPTTRSGRGASKYLHHSNSEGATSPNESDNTYAEASLLPAQQRPPLRYDLGYDSEIYANDQLVGASTNGGKYTQRSPPLSKGTNSRYIGLKQGLIPEASSTKSPFLSRGRGGQKSMELPPLPASNSRPPRQMAMAEAVSRGWDHNGLGGFQTNSMLETRIGNEDYMKHGGNLTMMGDRRGNRHNFNAAKSASLHRRSLSDDSMKLSHPSSPQALHGNVVQDPIVMPGFPVRTLQAHPPPPYSPSREKFLLGKRCRFHCSWKMVALSLTVLTLVLSSVIAYFGAVKFPSTLPPQQPDSAVISAASSAAASNGLECPPTIQEQPQAVIPQDYVTTASATTRPPSSPKRKRPQAASPIIPGQWYTASIEPLEMWLSQLFVSSQNTNFQMNLTVVNGQVASVAIYGRREAPPTVTNFDWVHMVAKDGHTVVKRSAATSAVSVEKVLPNRGDWYFGVLNDNDEAITVRSVFGQQNSGPRRPCPENCNGNGLCKEDGLCQCYPQFSGHDCSQNICPLLCSGHGVYGGGRCHCVDGWKGPECEVRETECLLADCSGHGQCREGVCLCVPGWTGENCQTRHCQDPKCGGHGVCQDAACICDIGWMGETCQLRNEALYQCLPDCSGHGMFNADLGKCECHSKWTGRDCNITVCGLDCGQHGSCLGSACVCQPGWSGARCNIKACDDRCNEHGQCINGTCVCHRGFNGKYCGIDGCGGMPNCHGHGECENIAEDGDSQRPTYECQCESGWSGDHCQIPEETECEDQIDNDNNGLTDCGDSKCCSHPSCRNSIMCMYLEDPVEVLLRKPPPTVASPFLKRVQFLFEGEDSVQNYAKQDAFDERRVSIIRGRVVTMTGQGIIGVRVSVDRTKDANNYGFTLTRPGGWFDMAVNGGGGVTLQFQRSPLKATTRTVYLPWNRIVVINPVIMTPHGGAGLSWNEDDSSEKVKYTQPCEDHEGGFQPSILSSYIPTLQRSTPNSSGIIGELSEMQESVKIPGTRDLHLVYRSSFSTIDMILTGPNPVAKSLKSVHVIVRVAGNFFSKILEPDPNLTYTFSWDKRNIYNQKVYGIVEAEVSVGYEYSKCKHILWTAQMVRIKGFHVDISAIGGWNLNIHHHYNPYQGLLQKGDGSMLELSSLYPRVLRPLIGKKGQKRDYDCKSSCNSEDAASVKLLSIVSLASGPDGSIYIGDFNLIRKFTPKGEVFTVMHFDDAQRAFDYDLTVSPADSRLYLSNSKSHQIWALKSLDKKDVKNPSQNWEVVAGTGERCVPGDGCGDGGPAERARLNYPKGIAISTDKSIYISDSRNIRVVNPLGIIQTLIGTQDRPKGPPRPLPCLSTFLASQIDLQWPSKLAINPLDGNLHIVDDTMILELTSDLKLKVKAGISPMCTATKNETFVEDALGPVLDLAFDQDGQLYFLEKRGENLLQRLDRLGQIDLLDAQCSNCSSLALSPKGQIFAADNEALEIVSIDHALPVQDEDSGEVEVADPLAGEIYTFNRFSQHISTMLLETRARMYTFVYTKNTALGRLSDIIDGLGNSLSIKRDYAGKVQSIDNSLGQKYALTLGPMGRLKGIFDQMLTYSYDDSEGHLISMSNAQNGQFRQYDYDKNGLVKSMTSSDGGRIEIDSRPCSSTSHCVRISGTAGDIQVHQNGAVVYNQIKGKSCVSSIVNKKLEWSVTGMSCSRVLLRAHPSLMSQLWSQGKPTSQWLSLQAMSNLMTWTYKSAPKQLLSKQLQFGTPRSNQAMLGVHYDTSSNEEAFYNGQGQRLLSVSYKNGLLPIQWSSGSSSHNCTQTFDRLHRLIERRCGQIVESFGYNEQNGRLEETRKSCQRRPEKFTYAPNSLHTGPRDIVLPSGKRFSYAYDASGHGLASVRLPGGVASIKISSQFGIFGETKVHLTLPGNTEPFTGTFGPNGELLQLRTPSGNGNVVYRYNDWGQLSKMASGDSITTYEYNEARYLNRIYHDQEFSMKVTHAVKEDRFPDEKIGRSLQETRIDFDAKSGMASAKFETKYEADFTNPIVTGRIGAKSLPDYYIHHEWSTTAKITAKKVGRFVVHPHDLNVTSISDGQATFSIGADFEALIVEGREIFRSEIGLDSCGKIASNRMKLVKSSEFTQIWKYVYDTDGQLESAAITDNTEWRYSYDSMGSIIGIISTSGRSSHKSVFEYDEIGRFKGPKVKYDDKGNVAVTFKGAYANYDTFGRLSTVKSADFEANYFYDHHGRLIGHKANNDELTQFFYAIDGKPSLLSHVYKPREGSLYTYIYGPDDRLIFYAKDNQEFYVVTDRNGSPIVVVSTQGFVVKEITRSPFGEVTYDSNRNIEIHVGFYGGLFDGRAGLVHFQHSEGSRAYDPLTGSFLTPAWKKVLLGYKDLQLFQPLSLWLLYRFPRNDPINAKFNPFQDPESLQSSLRKHIETAQPSFHDPTQLGQDASSPLGHVQMLSKSNFRRVLDQVEQLSFILPQKSALAIDKSSNVEIARLTSPLGKFVSLSLNKESNQVSVHAVPSGNVNEVPRDVFHRVLNGAFFAVKIQHGGSGESFYFVKPNIYDASADVKSLHRLGPSVNLTTHDSQSSDGTLVVDVKIHLEDVVVSIRYGASIEAERLRVLRHASKLTLRKALKNDNNFGAEFVRSIEEFPELVGDMSNILYGKPRP